MKEIKFRAWDKKKRKGSKSGMSKSFSLLEALEMNNTNFDGWKDQIFMQYIGLNDKYDIEIYDGDIILHKWEGDCYGGSSGEMIFEVKQAEQSHYINFDCLAAIFPWQIEIIGNIYENPKLMRKI